ncbi:outer membrane beta-barrel protein [Amphritea pacifica]|uniref:outer membrane beta-barrel protein n=1 Tax=Amphritea pacifica TaxID=2811233 RepID=UPI001964D7F1|nr:outer membrane beta-barrel protein [Amphritea pacifica]MBN1006917.1 outer membrane beta-barrel protein [Amphritea pacifica]
MKKFLLGLGVVAFLSPAVANAGGGYLGASYGYTKLELSNTEKAALNSFGITVTDDSDQGYKIFGGYRYNDYFAVEAFYADFGDLELSNGAVTVSEETSGYGLSAVGLLPVTENIDLFAKAGVMRWSIDATSNIGGTAGNDGNDITFGVGAEYTLDVVTVRAEMERFEIGDSSMDLVSVGLALNF